MTKNKIAFAGFMGAILMSVGAANAATTSIATKGYVDEKIGGVTTTINNLGETYATPASVTTALNNLKLDTTYQKLADKVQAISESMTDEEKTTKYPSVKAVLDAMPKLTEADKNAIKDLTGDTGLITRVEKVENRLDGDATVDGSVAKQIATALADYTPTEDLPTYQAKSDADFQIGTTGGVFRTLSDDEQAALKSGITKTKVEGYDALTGADGAVAKLQTSVDKLTNEENGTIKGITDSITDLGNAVDDLTKENGTIDQIKGDVSQNKEDIAANADDISTLTSVVGATENDGLQAKVAANTIAIGKKIDRPGDCDKQACVLMIKGENISWTPVTTPLDDPAETPPASESSSEGQE